MPRRTAVDQKVFCWDGGHPGLTVWNLLITQELRMHIKCARKIRVLLCGCYMYNYLVEGTDTGLCEQWWSIRLNCQLMTKIETKHILQVQVCDCTSTKKQTGNQWCIIKSAKSSMLKLNSFEIWLRKSIKRL